MSRTIDCFPALDLALILADGQVLPLVMKYVDRAAFTVCTEAFLLCSTGCNGFSGCEVCM